MNGLDWLAQAFGSVVTDIRERLVEEPWFGQNLSKSEHGVAPSRDTDLGWIDWKSREQQPTGPSHDSDHDLDR